MRSYTYVIVGGGMAGGRASDGIRKVDQAGSLVIVTNEGRMPYERPPLSKGYLMGRAGLDKVYLRSEEYYAENDIQVITGTRVTKIHPPLHTITLDDEEVVEYERLLLATGGRAWRLPIPGNDLENVLTLRTIADSEAIQDAARAADQALILGGSFIGSEVASALAQLGLDVTMVFPESRLLERVVPKALSQYLHDMYAERGVRILAGRKPERLTGESSVQQAVLDDGTTLDAQVVVMGVGIRLNTEIARDAGLAMWEDGAVMVDPTLQTSDPNIYAAGDIAAWPDPTFDKRLRVEHWDVARRQGIRAGRNMAGEEKPYTALPYFFSDLFDLSFEVWGDLSAWEKTVLRGSLDDGSFAVYYFDAGTLVGALVVDRPKEERTLASALVKAGLDYEETAAALRDEGTDLAALVE
jgi:NAD(P)H-nitrite reductase large subunit